MELEENLKTPHLGDDLVNMIHPMTFSPKWRIFKYHLIGCFLVVDLLSLNVCSFASPFLLEYLRKGASRELEDPILSNL